MNIFELAQCEDARQRKANGRNTTNGSGLLLTGAKIRHVLVCGAPNSGKSTWIARFLETAAADARRNRVNFSASSIKTCLPPTVALDCRYARRGGISDTDREIVYIWELGSGGSLANLINLIFTPQSISHFSVFLFVDLCRANDFQAVVMPLLEALRQSVDAVSYNGSDSARRSVRARYSEHKDSAIIRPFDISFTVIAAKYDLFQNVESERKRTVWRLLRYLAHINSANLVTLSNNVETLMLRSLTLLTSCAFGDSAPIVKQHAVDMHNAVYIGALTDSVDDIDLALRTARVASYDEAMRQWTRALMDNFPQGGALSSARRSRRDNTESDNLTKDSQYAEPIIDRLLDEKMRMLELFIKRRLDRRAASQVCDIVDDSAHRQ